MVAELGVRSMLCVQLFVTQDLLGPLSIYSHRTDAFDQQDKAAALALAAHVAAALSSSHAIEKSEVGIENRTIIGQPSMCWGGCRSTGTDDYTKYPANSSTTA